MHHTLPDHYHLCMSSSDSSSAACCYEDIHDSNNTQQQLPILEERVLLLMRQREQELKALIFSHRALSMVSNRCELLKLIQLRVVREFGLPDAASDVLHGNHGNAYRMEAHADEMMTAASRLSYVPSEVGSLSIPPPPRPLTNTSTCPSVRAISSDKDPYSYASEMKLENRSSNPRSHYDLDSQFSSNESRHTLSDLMPDIAMASAGIENLHLSRRTSSSHADSSSSHYPIGMTDNIQYEQPRFV